ncbi:MAG: sigma-54-dependent Fis family transcriptional regulator [Candidatus Xiphinematobacter sp.]|nr:MAG: sigma-54-dependent Fis family transcriptional regulator [Candidatus Xiphinematobacter sp.]QQY09900.1 MAG: sigma-54-dependent Fis family transcriptional regulator [Candidatus Xiphinematobacter sp.]QQY10633.1 MAG: sigma-54-dependent Fis family transcriptional regulator [Candidatus Xiphinematobacter sp.]QQY11375.1 MAG: sigma-54-dependent Fis family transcriptional regulator [Candidatus Xiphinematobacter sp.]
MVSLKPTLLVVDDEKNAREGLRASLDDAFKIFVASDTDEALTVLGEGSIDVLITDLRLGVEDGMHLIDAALKLRRPPLCIMVTAYGTVDVAVEAIKRGAYDFVTKPLNLKKLELLIERGLRERVKKGDQGLKQRMGYKSGSEGIIGTSPVIAETMQTIRQVASSRATVLILGESGTGKELAARAIHHLSPRSAASFVAVHCAALSPQLLESELFGHEKGAFTGAMERRIGRFEQASGGTLFLDEIGEIDLSTQVKILRVLGERTFERVGSNHTLKTNVRLIAATNKNLQKLVSEGKFRDDLFFRLNVVQITMPALRRRREDIPALAQAFLEESCRENGKPLKEIDTEAMACLLEYHWPGNVRELRTVIEHGVVMSKSPLILPRDLPVSVHSRLSSTLSACLPDSHLPLPLESPTLRETQHNLILRTLEICKGNRSEAARKLGISRRTLYRRLRQLGMQRD